MAMKTSAPAPVLRIFHRLEQRVESESSVPGTEQRSVLRNGNRKAPAEPTRSRRGLAVNGATRLWGMGRPAPAGQSEYPQMGGVKQTKERHHKGRELS